MTPETITLADNTTGSSATILAGYGFNCFSFRPVALGQSFEALWAAANFEAGTERASGSGIPILFPFPGRIRGTAFSFEGRQFPLEAGDGRGNAIHGFVLYKPWRVIDQSPTHVTGQFQTSVDDPSILDRWPADFRITATYRLDRNRLSSSFVVDNPSDRPLPFGLGTHPYFRVPLGNFGDAARCIVSVPASEHWELLEMLPTGKQLPAGGTAALAAGVPFGETRFDDVFSGLQFTDGQCTASISDPQYGRRLRITFDQGFSACVVYNPPHREAIAIEPYTCIPDPFTLSGQGIETGLRVLAPGETFQAAIDIAVDGEPAR